MGDCSRKGRGVEFGDRTEMRPVVSVQPSYLAV